MDKLHIFEEELREISGADHFRIENECYQFIIEDAQKLAGLFVKLKKYGMDYSVRESYLNRKYQYLPTKFT